MQKLKQKQQLEQKHKQQQKQQQKQKQHKNKQQQEQQQKPKKQQKQSPTKEEVHHSDIKLDIPIITQPPIVEEEDLNKEVHITHQSEVVHVIQQPNIQIIEEEITEK
jgi:hypothetical protein